MLFMKITFFILNTLYFIRNLFLIECYTNIYIVSILKLLFHILLIPYKRDTEYILI